MALVRLHLKRQLLAVGVIALITYSCDDTSTQRDNPTGGESIGQERIAGESFYGGEQSSDHGSMNAGQSLSAGESIIAGEVTGAEDGMTAGDGITAGDIMDAGQAMTAGENMSAGSDMINAEGLLCEADRTKSSRLVSLSFPHSNVIGEPGKSVQLFELSSSGSMAAWGDRLELNDRNGAMAFTQDGQWLIAVDERGEVTSIDLRGDTPRLEDTLTLPLGSYRAIQVTSRRRTFDVVNANSDELAGVYSVSVDCDGQLTADVDHFALRVIQGFQRVTRNEGDEAIIFGGQALFDPVDLIDLRWLSWNTSERTEIAHLDLYADFIDAINVGVSPSGDWITAVNGSPFTEEGGQVRFIRADRESSTLEERAMFEDLTDVRGAWFLPNGDTVFITRFEPNILQFFTRNGETWTNATQLRGVGLVEDATLIEAPAGADEEAVWILAPSTMPSGESGVVIINAIDGESVMMLPMALLGEGYDNIPKHIAAWPQANINR